MRKIYLMLLCIVMITQAFAQQNNQDSIRLTLEKSKSTIYNTGASKVDIVMNPASVLRFSNFSLCHIKYQSVNEKDFGLTIFKDNVQIDFEYSLFMDEILLKLPNDNKYDIYSKTNGGVTKKHLQINTYKYNTNDPIEVSSELYKPITAYQLLDDKTEINLQTFILNQKEIDFFEKISFLQRHLINGKPFSKDLESTIISRNLFNKSSFVSIAGKITRPPNPWDLLEEDIQNTIVTTFPVELFEKNCQCSYIIMVNFAISPKNNTIVNGGTTVFNVLNTDEKAREYFPVVSTNDLGGNPLNVNPWQHNNWAGDSWRDGFRNEFGAAKDIAIWSSGWANLFGGPDRDSFSISTIQNNIPNQGGLNHYYQSYSLLCTGNTGIKNNCGCSKDITVKYRYDNVLTSSADLDGSSNANNKSWSVAVDNAVALVQETGNPVTSYLVDYGLSEIQTTCQMTKTPEWLNAKAELIKASAKVATDAVLLAVFIQLGIPPNARNLDSIIAADPTFIDTLDKMFTTITGKNFLDFVQAAFDNIANLINATSTLNNTVKFTPGSCGGSTKTGAQNLIDKTFHIQLNANKPLNLYLNSYHKLEIGGERRFHNSAQIKSGGYIAAYLDPAYYTNENVREACCTEKYGRWVVTSFGPTALLDYQDAIGNFMSTQGGLFYPIYPSGSFANVGILGNTGAIRGDAPENCKEVPIYDGNRIGIQVQDDETSITIKSIKGDGNYSLIDINGQIIKTGNIMEYENVKINKSDFAHGVYFITTFQNGDSKSYKFLNK